MMPRSGNCGTERDQLGLVAFREGSSLNAITSMKVGRHLELLRSHPFRKLLRFMHQKGQDKDALGQFTA